MLLKDKGKQIENEKTSYNFFLQRGYSPEAASALTGNFVYESGLRTTAVGDKGYKGGNSEGIAQFREDRLKRLKSRYGDNWTDLNNQLDFVDWELKNTHKNAGQALLNAKTVHEAGQIVSDKYEIPAKKYQQNPDRRKAVESIYSKYSGMQITAPESNVTPEVTNLPQETEKPKFTAEESEAQRVLQERQQQVNALDELFAGQEENIQNLYRQAPQQPQTLPQEDLNQTFAQVSNFVESPLFQAGGIVKDNIPNLQPKIMGIGKINEAQQFTIEYIQSPKYKERLLKSGYSETEANKEIIERLKNVDETKVLNQEGKPSLIKQFYNKLNGIPYSNQGSIYDEETVIIDNKTDRVNTENKKLRKGEVEAHEFAHAETFKKGDLNKKELQQLSSRLKPDVEVPHDKSPYENKADLNSLRFLLKKDGIYDAGKQDFNKDMLKKAPNSYVKDRLLKNYSEDDLIWLMNNIAQNELPTNAATQMAQMGGIIDPAGQYKFPGQITIIPSSNITMKGLGYDIFGIDNLGNVKLMKPDQNYNFPGNVVTEYPLKKDAATLKKLAKNKKA